MNALFEDRLKVIPNKIVDSMFLILSIFGYYRSVFGYYRSVRKL